MKKIPKKFLIAGGVAIVAIVLIAGYMLKSKSNTSSTLTKLTGTIESISTDKSSLSLKTDTTTYNANLATAKTLKNNTGGKITIDDIKLGDNIELRTRTSLNSGKTTQIDTYSLKDLSIIGTEASTKTPAKDAAAASIEE